ncbi:MAG: HAD-IA family hydrolase [Hyphomicrobiales bacterium]
MKLIIFDCDGTLIDSQNVIFASMTNAFQQLGFTAPSRERALSIVGLSLVEAMQKLLPNAAHKEHVQLAEAYKQAFWEARQNPDNHEPFYEGMFEIVKALNNDDDVLLGIATGKSQRGVRRIIDGFGLHDHFITIQTADDAPSKPHPGMIHNALSETGVEPQRTLMIGDTTYDIDMAHAASVHAMAVSWGYHSNDALVASAPHYFAHTHHELDAYLEHFLNTREVAHGE